MLLSDDLWHHTSDDIQFNSTNWIHTKSSFPSIFSVMPRVQQVRISTDFSLKGGPVYLSCSPRPPAAAGHVRWSDT